MENDKSISDKYNEFIGINTWTGRDSWTWTCLCCLAGDPSGFPAFSFPVAGHVEDLADVQAFRHQPGENFIKLYSLSGMIGYRVCPRETFPANCNNCRLSR
jgi:hypothetical protein